MSKRVLTYIISTLSVFSSLHAQEKAYFQQFVEYKIQVELEDRRHFLRGNLEMEYHNNSNDTLSFIFMHIWPNAYSGQHTAFAKQLLDQGRLDFHFSKKEERGYMDSLNFSSDGRPLKIEIDYQRTDVIKVFLDKPLLPQSKVSISTPFKVKIPANFSRLAQIDQQYMVCQWYPKPAVYDHKGWHAMSYLDQGEFYSEFANFDVEISLPANYIVAATGVLQTQTEINYLDSLGKDTQKRIKANDFVDSIPNSSTKTKHIRYIARNVHDFAWFANKRFMVKRDSVQLVTGEKSIQCYAMFTSDQIDKWKGAMKYIKRSLKFYSDQVGTYPYEQISVAQGLYKGSNMEYPMVTVIGAVGSDKALDNVIAHEIGHNWFYGILGSNERTYPWMDEGLNTYFDARYMQQYYQDNPRMEYLAYLLNARKKADKAINSTSESLSSLNYYICAYGKPTLSFNYLQHYLGTKAFDEMIQSYYNTWKFRHPYPEDLKASFNSKTNKEINWFFEALIEKDYKIDFGFHGKNCCQGGAVNLRNKGKASLPVRISHLDQEGKELNSEWIESLKANSDTCITEKEKDQAFFYIDYPEVLPEINRNNNIYRVKDKPKTGERLKVSLLADIRNPEKPRLNLLPLIGFNFYDGFMIGASAYNLFIPQRAHQYRIAPFFGINSLTSVGIAEWVSNVYHKDILFSTGIHFKTFHKRQKTYSAERPYSFKDRYYKISPYLEIKFPKKQDQKNISHSLLLKHSLIIEEAGKEKRNNNGIFNYYEYLGKETTWRSTHRLIYLYKNKQAQLPLDLKSMFEYANYADGQERQHYIKIAVEGKMKFMYSKRWGVDLRFFVGAFPFHTDRAFGEMPLNLVAGNRTDYHYDHNILGRREYENALSQQVTLQEGAFKTAIEPVIDNGSSNSFIFALNLKSDIPIKLPFGTRFVKLKPFLDIGYYKNTAPSVTIQQFTEELFVSGGLMLDIWDGRAGVYLPLFGTDNIENKIKSFVGNEFYKRITFSFNINHRLIEEIVEEIY